MKQRTVVKPWGTEWWWTPENAPYLGKRLTIRPRQSLSLQFHRKKTETILVESGLLTVDYQDQWDSAIKTITRIPGEVFHVKPPMPHRFRNETDSDVVILEVSTNHPQDVVRLEDRYGRTARK